MKVGLMLPIGQQELLQGPDRWSLLRDMTLAAVAQLGAAAAIARERTAARGAAV